MKNKFIALALVTLSIATTTVSCTKDDAIPTTKADVVKGKLSVPLNIDGATNPTGKSVLRGTLPIAIDKVNITAQSLDFTYSYSDVFGLVANGTVGADASFILDQIAVGHNQLTISTMPALGVNPTLSVGSSNQTVDAIMATLKAQTPYAIYNGTTTANVIQGATNTIAPTTLTTVNGRNIAVFQLSDELKSLGVTAKITAAPTPNNSTPPAFSDITVSTALNGQIYWNNLTATDTAKLYFTVTLYDAHGTILPTTSQIPAPLTGFFIANTVGTSTNTIYTIAQGGLIPSVATETFTAVWNNDNDGTGTIGHN